MCVCEGVGQRGGGGKRKKEGESAFFNDREPVSEIGCVCARMKLILPSSQLPSLIQRMK